MRTVGIKTKDGTGAWGDIGNTVVILSIIQSIFTSLSRHSPDVLFARADGDVRNKALDAERLLGFAWKPTASLTATD
jgi:hypothetical protein